MKILNTVFASMLSAGLIGSTIESAMAAPLPTNAAAMKSLAASGPIQVHWHGGWGWGWGAGALAGALIGGAIASSAYGYYGDPYYSGYPYGYYHPRAVHYGYRPYYYGYRPYAYYRPYPLYRYHHHYRHWHHHRHWRHHW
ncbi:hypothetical protein ACQR18_19260 [Bradyrhizobium oligotrophicum]|uniref:hypothetical protein n=1 Tax=Bradyrhizobium oligotrophicum TaxID=44255 RepID=UPI003EB9F8B6